MAFAFASPVAMALAGPRATHASTKLSCVTRKMLLYRCWSAGLRATSMCGMPKGVGRSTAAPPPATNGSNRHCTNDHNRPWHMSTLGAENAMNE